MPPRYDLKPPTLSNNLSYTLFLILSLFLIHHYGDSFMGSLRDRFSEFTLVVPIGFLYYMTLFWTLGIFFMVLDKTQSPRWLYQYRIQSSPPPKNQPSLGRAVRVVLFNQIFGTLPFIVALFYLMKWRGMSFDTPISPWYVILGHLIVMILVEEVAFYVIHRLGHHPKLYPKVHIIHHQFTQPIGISTHYVHYAEHMLCNLLPLGLGVLITGCHYVTFILWFTFAIVNAIQTHSCYNFPWMTYAVHHDFHHFQFRGNYGVIGLLDWLLGTDKKFRKLVDKQSKQAGSQQAAYDR